MALRPADRAPTTPPPGCGWPLTTWSRRTLATSLTALTKRAWRTLARTDRQTHEPMTASLAPANSISHLDVTFRYRRRSTRSSVGGGAEGQMLDRQGSALENELMFDAKLLEAAEGYEDGFEAGLPSSLDTSPGFGSPETVSDSEGDAIVRCV